MKIKVICLGSLQDRALENLEKSYLKRLARYRVERIELTDGNDRDATRRLQEEAQRIEKKISPTDTVVLLDEKGKGKTSKELAEWIESKRLQSIKSLVFILGSSHGISAVLKEKFLEKLGLSQMTLTHDLARILLLEQLYRAHTILEGVPYHH